ncbi:MAG: hypothetical protein EOL89_14125, partial [Actinobacteria bacterium]|nr:hypothetical protein [Actinomycetota bacterium]
MAADGTNERAVLLREFVTSALYLSLALWATALLIPADVLPSKWILVAEVFGIAVALLLMHWLAFSLAVQLVDRAELDAMLYKEGGAQLAGGLAVAAIAALPFIILDRMNIALTAALWMLAAIPALTGYAIARQRGSSQVRSTGVAAVVAAAAFAV